MKKTLALIITIILLLSLAACGQPAAEKGEGLSVVATVFAPYELARQIAGERAEVTLLLPPGAEVHGWEPTPKDVIAVQESGLFVYVGGESDEWVRSVLSGMDARPPTLTLMDCVELFEEEHEHEHEEEHGDGPEYDEHVWTSPRNAALICQKLCAELSKIDPEGAEYYEKNLADYLEKLDELDAAFESVVASGARKTLIFADRFPLRYFTESYGLDYLAAFPGCAEETEPSAATVALLIDEVKAEDIPVVFHLELSNEDMADEVCAETGAKKLQWNACHNITREQLESGVTYIDLMWENVDALREALD